MVKKGVGGGGGGKDIIKAINSESIMVAVKKTLRKKKLKILIKETLVYLGSKRSFWGHTVGPTQLSINYFTLLFPHMFPKINCFSSNLNEGIIFLQIIFPFDSIT